MDYIRKNPSMGKFGTTHYEVDILMHGQHASIYIHTHSLRLNFINPTIEFHSLISTMNLASPIGAFYANLQLYSGLHIKNEFECVAWLELWMHVWS